MAALILPLPEKVTTGGKRILVRIDAVPRYNPLKTTTYSRKFGVHTQTLAPVSTQTAKRRQGNLE